MGDNTVNDEAEKLVRELTDLLIDKGCTINKPAIIDLAIYVLEREKATVKEMSENA